VGEFEVAISGEIWVAIRGLTDAAMVELFESANAEVQMTTIG
jgi:hypothetical protein